MNFREAFPDYPETDMPATPDRGDFVDTSWRNNACPSITSDALGLHIWIDYADPSRREHPVSRFIVERQDHGIETGHTLLETDEWNDVLDLIGRENGSPAR